MLRCLPLPKLLTLTNTLSPSGDTGAATGASLPPTCPSEGPGEASGVTPCLGQWSRVLLNTQTSPGATGAEGGQLWATPRLPHCRRSPSFGPPGPPVSCVSGTDVTTNQRTEWGEDCLPFLLPPSLLVLLILCFDGWPDPPLKIKTSGESQPLSQSFSIRGKNIKPTGGPLWRDQKIPRRREGGREGGGSDFLGKSLRLCHSEMLYRNFQTRALQPKQWQAQATAGT